MVTREAIKAEAWSWVKTKYHPSARIKGVGVDCAQLLYMVYNSFGLIPDMPLEARSSRWFVSNKDQSYLTTILSLAKEITEGEVGAGDLVLFRQPDYEIFHHAGIVIAWPTIIHAVRGLGVCMADGLKEGFLQKCERRYFSFFYEGNAGKLIEANSPCSSIAAKS
jgi:cell wall-associated NlpC family hydrolase